ncbi:MAG: tetratricopeptide repeat protein, partial [Candidatus Sumerlaeia bacterium]|nr:tetratricopeptide repeat protein [Candidatus Sumerlaeia bacterium]
LALRIGLAQDLAAEGHREESLAEYRRVAGEAMESNPRVARTALEAILDQNSNDMETLRSLVAIIDNMEGIQATRPYRHRLYELMVTGCQDDTYLTPEVNARMVELINADLDDQELRDHHVTYLSSRGRHLDAAMVLHDYSRTLLEKERLEDSLAALERALGHAPTSLEILIELATRLEQAGKNDRAVDEWRQVLDLAMEAEDIQASQQAWGRIVRLLPGRPDILHQYGSFLDGIGETDEAMRIYRQAVEYLLGKKEHEDAIPILERMIEIDPEDCGARGQLADCLLTAGRGEEATEARLLIVGMLMERGDLAWATKVAMQAREEAPDSVKARELLAAVHARSGKLEEASVEYKALIEALLDDGEESEAVGVLRGVAEKLMESNQYESIRAIMEPFPDLVGTDPQLMHAYALSLESTDREEAAGERWLQLARLMWQGGEGKQAEAHLRRAIALNPQDRTARFLLVEIMEKRGGTREELIQEYHDLAKLARSEGNTEEAISLLEKLLEIESRDVVALRRLAKLLAECEHATEALRRYLELGAAHVELGDMEAARRAYSGAALLDPLDPRPIEGLYKIAAKAGDAEDEIRQGCQLVEILQQGGDDDGALNLLEEMAERHPRYSDVRFRLANHYETEGETDRAIAHLRRLFSILHDSRDFAGAIDALHRIESIDPSDPENLAQTGRLYAEIRDNNQAADYFLMAAESYRDRDKGAEALDVAAEGLRQDPWHEGLLLIHVAIARSLGQTETAAGSVEKLVELAGREQNPEKEAAAIMQLAELRPEDEKLRERLALLYSDLDMSVEAAEQFLLLSSLHESRGNSAEALDAASTAATLAPDLPAPHERLALLHGNLGQSARATEEALWLAKYYEGADRPIDALNALEAIPEKTRTATIRLRIARLRELAGKSDGALELYREIAASREEAHYAEALEGILRLDPTDLDIHAELDRELRNKGRFDDAQRVSFDLFENLLSRGEVDQARQVVEAAQPHATDQFQFLRDTATHYEDHGLPELAAIALRTLAGQLADERPEHALELMERSLTLKPWEATSKELRFDLLEKLHKVEDLAEAGSDLITVRVSRMDLKGACDIARRVIRMDDEALEPRLRLAELLEKLNESKERSGILQELADLYLKKGKIEEALDVLRTLIKIHPDNTLFRRRFIDTYRQVGPDSDLINEYIPLAKTLAKNGKSHEAIKVFERLLSFAAENLTVHQEFIDFLFEASQLERAVTQSQLYAEKLLQVDKPREALSVLERIKGESQDDPQFHTVHGKAHLACKARGAGVRELRRAATLYRDSGEHSSEADILSLVCAEDTYNLEARQLLVEALISAGRTEEAAAASLDLANTYKQRGLPDLALGEYRRLLGIDPDKPDVWKDLFDIANQLGVDHDIIDDYLEYADLLARRGDTEEAVGCYRRAMELDQHNLRAHRGFVVQYQKIGSEKDIMEEMMTFAELLIEAGEPDEAVKYFELVMTLDPQNTRARDMLDATKSSTTSKIRPKGAEKLKSKDTKQAIKKGFLDDELGLTDTQKRFIYQATSAASEAPSKKDGDQAGEEIPGADDTLEQAVLNYRNILAVNAGNANVRLKLADVLGQMGRDKEMIAEMTEAAGTFLKKSQLDECVETCNRILKIVPSSHQVRRLLNEAEIKRDAMKALDSTISFLKLESREKEEE